MLQDDEVGNGEADTTRKDYGRPSQLRSLIFNHPVRDMVTVWPKASCPSSPMSVFSIFLDSSLAL